MTSGARARASARSTDAPPVADLVGRMKTEFDQARQEFLLRASAWNGVATTRDQEDDMLRAVALIGVACLALGASRASAESEIRIGQTLPYSGPASGFGVIGRTQEAFFAKINADGGINGHKVKFITVDDAYSPPKTVEQTRKLVEQDEVRDDVRLARYRHQQRGATLSERQEGASTVRALAAPPNGPSRRSFRGPCRAWPPTSPKASSMQSTS